MFLSLKDTNQQAIHSFILINRMKHDEYVSF